MFHSLNVPNLKFLINYVDSLSLLFEKKLVTSSLLYPKQQPRYFNSLSFLGNSFCQPEIL